MILSHDIPQNPRQIGTQLLRKVIQGAEWENGKDIKMKRRTNLTLPNA